MAIVKHKIEEKGKNLSKRVANNWIREGHRGGLTPTPGDITAGEPGRLVAALATVAPDGGADARLLITASFLRMDVSRARMLATTAQLGQSQAAGNGTTPARTF